MSPLGENKNSSLTFKPSKKPESTFQELVDTTQWPVGIIQSTTRIQASQMQEIPSHSQISTMYNSYYVDTQEPPPQGNHIHCSRTKQRKSYRLCSDLHEGVHSWPGGTGLVSFLVAGMKHPDKGPLGRKLGFLAPSSRLHFTTAGESQRWELEGLVISFP